jgi:hypothetical protein
MAITLRLHVGSGRVRQDPLATQPRDQNIADDCAFFGCASTWPSDFSVRVAIRALFAGHAIAKLTFH